MLIVVVLTPELCSCDQSPHTTLPDNTFIHFLHFPLGWSVPVSWSVMQCSENWENVLCHSHVGGGGYNTLATQQSEIRTYYLAWLV